ncbi:MAG: DUF5362 family protein [Ferruginibacter sp.]
METNESLLTPELQIDGLSLSYLAEAAKWGKFLSILGFISSAILVIIALFAGVLLGTLNSAYGGGGAILGAGFITVIYLIVAAVNFFIALFLFRFSAKMKIALYSTDQDTLNSSFLNLKNLFKLVGILTIIYIVFIVLALIFAIGAAAFVRG